MADYTHVLKNILDAIAASGGGGGSGGDASAANQTSVQAIAGSDASKAIAVQGVTGGKSIPITANAGTNLNTSALALESGGNLASILAKLPSNLGAKTAANSLAVTLSTDGIASGISTQIGEVQASPTANTVLDRLKSIATAIGLGAVSSKQIPAFTLSAIALGTANAATLKASAGAVYSLKVINKSANVNYLQVINKASTPTNSDSALIVDVIPLPGLATVIIDSAYFGATGLACSTGVSWAFSSTDTTITLATATDCIVTVGYA